MSGAFVPDDWDGETYKCIQITMPDSEHWRALLLGQIVEASQADFWDAETGDVDEAVAAIETAYQMTIENYPLECEQMTLDGFTLVKFQLMNGSNGSIVETSSFSGTYRAFMPAIQFSLTEDSNVMVEATPSYNLSASAGLVWRADFDQAQNQPIKHYCPFGRTGALQHKILSGTLTGNTLAAGDWNLQMRVYIQAPATISVNASGLGEGLNDVFIWAKPI